jgi:putative toxin-antitoxin system antitoxin component (TIGR02293 family)
MQIREKQLPSAKSAQSRSSDQSTSRSETQSRLPDIEIIRTALDVIGSPVRLAQWIHTHNPALRGKTPYSLLGSPAGRKQIETLLGRIEHGVY